MKNFDKWNLIKKKINNNDRVQVKLGEIFWCNLGINIGVEQDGDRVNFYRPVIVIKKFSNQIILIAPLTTQNHIGNWYFDINILERDQQIILNQIKPIDIKRLTKSIGQLTTKEVSKILGSYIQLIK